MNGSQSRRRQIGKIDRQRDEWRSGSEIGVRVMTDYLTAEWPVGAGDVRYYNEDGRGNVSRGTLERVNLA